MTESQPEGYLAIPRNGTGPGVLVLHAWWGLNDTIKAFSKRLADAGFMAFALDLYHGKLARTIPEAEVLGKELESNFKHARAEVAEAAGFICERCGQKEKGIAVIGFSLGAYYAVDVSLSDPEHVHSVVTFYGSGEGDFSKSQAAYLAHYADNDPYEEPIYAEKMEAALKQAGRPVTFYHYPGTTHWFFEPDRVKEYNKAAADLAWERTLAFLKLSAPV